MLRAARALAERVPRLRLGRFHLLKALPVAAGLGGGSSDAAAALRALAAANGLAPDDGRLFAAAAAVGADVPVCLYPSARRMAGRGEKLGPALRIAAAARRARQSRRRGRHARRVRRARPRARRFTRRAARAAARGRLQTRRARSQRSRPAATTCRRARRGSRRRSATTLDALARLDGVRLVRMSGSGATCFALFDDRHAAARAARHLRAAYPDWWVRATYLR